MRGWRLWFLAVLLTVVGCQPAGQGDQGETAFRGTDISHEKFGGALELKDHNGVKRSLKDFRGKWVVLFFGYTHCPDVCPTTLGDTAEALKLMTPEQAKQVQVIWVSVDPERDTPDMLRDYVTYFHPDFLSMTGTDAEIAKAASDFRIVYRRHVTSGVSGYLIDHTAGSYVIDPNGKLRLLLPFAIPAPDMAHDLTLLMQKG